MERSESGKYFNVIKLLYECMGNRNDNTEWYGQYHFQQNETKNSTFGHHRKLLPNHKMLP